MTPEEKVALLKKAGVWDVIGYPTCIDKLFDLVAAHEREKQAEQEQVAVLDITYGREPECYATPNADDLPEGTYRLYAAPVRTKDLTDDELSKLHSLAGVKAAQLNLFARSAIAADREKNK